MSSTQAKISLIVTLLFALFPYLRKEITKSDFVIQNIAPVCIDSQDKASPKRICLSCYEKDPNLDATGFGFWVTDNCDDSLSSKMYRFINSIDCHPLVETDREKKIVSFPVNTLICEEILQMFDYSQLNSADQVKNVEKIQFQKDIKPINEIISDLNMSVSSKTDKTRLFFNKKTKNVGILQITSHEQQVRTLIEVHQPSMDSIYYSTAGLSILALSVAIFLISLFFIQLVLHKQCLFEVFVNVICSLGLLFAFRQYSLHLSHNTILMMDLEVLWACICFSKMKMPNIWIYSMAILGVLLSVLLNSIGDIGFFRSMFLIAAFYLVFSRGKNNPEGQGAFIYLAPCVFLVTITTIWLSLFEDPKCYDVKYTTMILCLGLIQINTTLKIQQFQQYVESAAKMMKQGQGFQKVHDEEMDEQQHGFPEDNH